MKYKIIRSKQISKYSNSVDYSLFIYDVESHLNNGYLLVGGINIFRNHSGYYEYSQAMIKYNNIFELLLHKLGIK